MIFQHWNASNVKFRFRWVCLQFEQFDICTQTVDPANVIARVQYVLSTKCSTLNLCVYTIWWYSFALAPYSMTATPLPLPPPKRPNTKCRPLRCDVYVRQNDFSITRTPYTRLNMLLLLLLLHKACIFDAFSNGSNRRRTINLLIKNRDEWHSCTINNLRTFS